MAPAELCKQVLRDDEVFAVGFERSTVADILGEHMMSVDGEAARRYKRAFEPPFLPGAIRDQVEPRIALIARGPAESFCERGEVELRSGFAGRLPVLVMLGLLGLPAGDELLLRRWYDAFEAALANTGFDPQVRRVGKAAAAEFHEYIAAALGEVRGVRRPGTLLDDLVHADPDGPAGRLTDEEIACQCRDRDVRRHQHGGSAGARCGVGARLARGNRLDRGNRLGGRRAGRRDPRPHRCGAGRGRATAGRARCRRRIG